MLTALFLSLAVRRSLLTARIRLPTTPFLPLAVLLWTLTTVLPPLAAVLWPLTVRITRLAAVL